MTNTMLVLDANKSIASNNTESVRFDEEQNSTCEFDNDFALLHPENVWYQPEQYAEMKTGSRSDAREARKQGVGCLLSCTFDSPKPDAQVRITAFVRFHELKCLRGLERFLSREHGDERVDGRDRARSSVLIHQTRLKREGASDDLMVRTLAKVYEEAASSASAYARCLGIADELVIKEGEDSSVAQEYINAHMKAKKRHPTMERRLSNSNYSVQSQASMESRPRMPLRRMNKSMFSKSPASPSEEFYAAIA
jgi:hypothetical protein